MGPSFSLIQVIDGAANNYLYSMIYEMPDQLLERHHFRSPFHKSEVDHPKGLLHLSVFVELIQNDTRIGGSFQHDYYTDPFPVRLIPYFRNFRNTLLVNEGRNTLNKSTLINLITDSCNNNLFPVIPPLFHLRPSTHRDFTTASRVRFPNTLIPVDNTACGEIRCGYILIYTFGIVIRYIDIVFSTVDVHIMFGTGLVIH